MVDFVSEFPRQYAISGAQGEETFLEIFRKLAGGKKLAVESDEGDMC